MTIFSEDALKGEHILITGATGGIGMAAAKAAVMAGADVTITGRDEEKLAQLQESCLKETKGGTVISIPADLTKENDRTELLRQAEDRLGPVTGLVNSAGVGGGDTVDQLEEDRLRNIFELNFFSAVLLTQSVYKSMQENGRGAIVALSSLSGLRGTPGNGAYSGSKFAVTGFFQSLAAEAIKHQIRVNMICPGYVDTEMARASIQSKADRAGLSYEEQLEKSLSGIPAERMIDPEEVANTIVFLLSEAAVNIVGESVKISGGSVMR